MDMLPDELYLVSPMLESSGGDAQTLGEKVRFRNSVLTM